MVAVMRAARDLGAERAAVLRYADSGDAGEHDKSRVVGYLSAAFLAAA
jgi:AmmeMemoRadiSam system protein B